MPELEERIAVLEANFKHADAKLDKITEKVDEMHEVLLQAKGARWAILGVASLAGFFAGKIGTFLASFNIKM